MFISSCCEFNYSTNSTYSKISHVRINLLYPTTLKISDDKTNGGGSGVGGVSFKLFRILTRKKTKFSHRIEAGIKQYPTLMKGLGIVVINWQYG